jgi:hypothetical protein
VQTAAKKQSASRVISPVHQVLAYFITYGITLSFTYLRRDMGYVVEDYRWDTRLDP